MSKSRMLLAVAVLVLTAGGTSFAAEKENTLTGFLRNLFNYPVRATQETAEMTSNTLHNTGEKMVANVGETVGKVVTADLPAAGSNLGETVTGTAETVGQTAAETVMIPVDAAQEQK